MREPQSRTARIRALAKSDETAALAELRLFLTETFDIEVLDLSINYDQYSLNSLNGFFRDSKDRFFFKFHQEEGEEEMSGEYYRADLIAKANLPIDLPILTSVQPGEQILVYRRREDRRFSDVLRELDAEHDEKQAAIVDLAERELNDKILTVAKDSLHPVTKEQVANEPIHRLFYERLIDIKTREAPGGRFRKFYIGQSFEFDGATLSWSELTDARLLLNGQAMTLTIGEIFNQALVNLDPAKLANAGGIVAHGDAHNANVWFENHDGKAQLSYFDPAFAGEHFPSMLSEAKATFHNVFAHPFWLYDPQVAAESFKAQVKYDAGVLAIETDWALTPVRERLLRAKAEMFWKPFLMHLKERQLLPDNWETTLRSALAMSPALVMNLRAHAERHNPTSSAIGFYVTALVGSRPVQGTNAVTEFFDAIDPDEHG